MISVPLILAISLVAVGVLRVGGLRRLWLVCALTLLVVVLLALLLSAVYSTPSVWRVVLYFLGFVGPPILFATGSLTLASGLARTLPLQLVTALAGSMVGLGVGIVAITSASLPIFRPDVQRTTGAVSALLHRNASRPFLRRMIPMERDATPPTQECGLRNRRVP